jgi:predicted methyltransferase MtxX (methanogen marker protein 4)
MKEDSWTHSSSAQQIEIMGRNRLVNELIAAGIAVAVPLRDRGIDVIAYGDRDQGSADSHLYRFR